ncbi:uncharacterized protein cers1 [Rhincodon typus]|uniref:uncharacterized protein cers1 n=1 Tax=Rhincodon typus TaxID=259920 RepID=UPI00202EBA7F|nr:uncharacterized protein cers1 [Rhincodon typus]
MLRFSMRPEDFTPSELPALELLASDLTASELLALELLASDLTASELSASELPASAQAWHGSFLAQYGGLLVQRGSLPSQRSVLVAWHVEAEVQQQVDTMVQPMPGYGELLEKGFSRMNTAMAECTDCGFELSKRTLLENASLTVNEGFLFLICAVAWTLLRKAASRYLFQPLAHWCDLPLRDAAKMPESAWKLTFYTASWFYSTYLLFLTDYPFFHDPPSVFYGTYIILLVVKVLTGQVSEVNDVREYDIEDSSSPAVYKKYDHLHSSKDGYQTISGTSLQQPLFTNWRGSEQRSRVESKNRNGWRKSAGPAASVERRTESMF